MPSSRAQAPARSIPALADTEASPESHPRLNHTITLGEVDATPSGEQAMSADGQRPSVSVTINNYGPSGATTPGYASYYSGYAGFGLARGGTFGAARSSGGSVTGASRSSGSMQPGQNWPAVADHGSSFPYRSAPASPWR